jgi:undecaprenyl-diphosphatase
VLFDSVDDKLAVWVATHRLASLDDVFVWLGTIDKVGLVWVALALVLGLLVRLRLWSTVLLAASTGLAVFAADSICFGLKDVVERTRPFVAHPQIQPLYVVHSGSFPAGHAATAFAGATLLSYVAPRAAPGFLLLAAAIGFSRVYVGVHYPGDVAVGVLIGVAVAVGAIILLKWASTLGIKTAASLTQAGSRANPRDVSVRERRVASARMAVQAKRSPGRSQR